MKKTLHAPVKLIIAIFMICTFSIGFTEYVVMGILTSISKDLSVPISSTGLLVTAYAGSVCLTGPIVTIFSVKMPRKPVLLGLMSVFVLSNALSFLAPNFTVLLISRILSASIHGAFFAATMVFVSEMVPPEKRAAAAASMNGGLTIALMLGVPFGSYLGDLFNWRIVFLMIVCLGLIGLAGIWLTVPHRKPKVVPKLIHEWDVFKNKQVLFSFAITIFGYSGVFIAYTFIEPMLRHSAGFGSLGITAALFAYGFGGVVGNFYAGKVPFHLLTRSMIGVMIALMAILAAFPFVSGHPAGAIIVTFLFGAGAFGTVPLLQTKVVAASEHGTTIATSVSIAAFNLANALGAWIGGLILNASESYTYLATGGALMTMCGLTLTMLAYVSEKRQVKEEMWRTDL
ncbi:MFS transporter [Bacillus haynesii]|uniref:MFS transporter n=1 Tax=Bacillus haynesii TaxID=1925021 RepID=UPI002281B8F0|nr:MFS transporter [Bacillus haynesii]MCY7914308.1 MFS transporter [Bacillus haynesii]MCY7924507.1 MFS transporter [Bacillus haynesii]MCY7999108.1 MFS transporter [Bacillus haynesii]MCY8558241.1 MFS transporter [Bacillus haynesii]MCY8771479.1 MFS transporter [Bacillus haynesii]